MTKSLDLGAGLSSVSLFSLSVRDHLHTSAPHHTCVHNKSLQCRDLLNTSCGQKEGFHLALSFSCPGLLPLRGSPLFLPPSPPTPHFQTCRTKTTSCTQHDEAYVCGRSLSGLLGARFASMSSADPRLKLQALLSSFLVLSLAVQKQNNNPDPPSAHFLSHNYIHHSFLLAH